MLRYLLICLCCFLAACSSVASEKESKLTRSKTTLAKLYAAEFFPTKLQVKVLSSGCSQPKHFKLVYNQVEENKTEISVIRLKRDMCRKKYFLKSIELELDPVISTDLMQFTLKNNFKQFKYGS